MRAVKIFFALLLAAVAAIGQHSQAADLVAPDKIKALVAPLTDGGWAYGVAVGLINSKGTQTAGYGHVSDQDSQAPSGDTIFEIGSVSKVFTGLLLAEMVEDKTVTLNEPVQKLLGDSMKVPEWEGRAITLVDIATHTSGLPRLPANLKSKDPTNPYADYTFEQLVEFITGHKLRRSPGEKAEYSNLGMGLLGHALAVKAGTTYEELLRKRICEPLKMNETRIVLDEAQRKHLAQGHDSDGHVIPNWDLPTLAGAGAIRSTATDMLKFLGAYIDPASTPIASAIRLSEQVQYKAPQESSNDTGLAWQIRRKDGVVWHNGQTGGYHSFAAFSPEKRAGVVVLATTNSGHIDALGIRLYQLLTTGTAEPLDLPKSIELESAALERLLGKYRLSPLVTATVTRQGNQLMVQLTGQSSINVYPETNMKFLYRAVDASITFQANDADKIDMLVLHQNGRDLSAPKIE